MTDKEKAKAYDEALKKASAAHKDEDRHLKATLERIFPELKESEDEKIRKEIISILHNAYWTSNRNRFNKLVAWLEKQDKKSTDKIEPRFNVGDWVVNKFGDSWHIDSFDKKNYQVSNGKGDYNYFPISKQEEMHLWTIQDAKDGDVLSFYSEYKGNKMVQIGIIEKYVGKHGGCSNTFKIYIGVNWDNNLKMDKYMGCSDIHPATKEQRDALMKAMNDAGYEWDAEKKELKKLKQLNNYKGGLNYEINSIL